MNVFRPAATLVCAHFTPLAFRLPHRSLAGACLSLFIPLIACAQPVDRDSLNAQTTAPSMTYESAFSDLQALPGSGMDFVENRQRRGS